VTSSDGEEILILLDVDFDSSENDEEWPPKEAEASQETNAGRKMDREDDLCLAGKS